MRDDPRGKDRDGELVLLEDQDRSRWDATRIAEGRALVERALRMGRVGPYQLQAAIAAVHDEAPTAADTDWAQILGLYEVLRRVSPSPVVDLNRAVALAQVEGPEAGLAAVDALARPRDGGVPLLPRHPGRLPAPPGPVARGGGCLRAGADLATNAPERAFLERRIAEVRGRRPD